MSKGRWESCDGVVEVAVKMLKMDAKYDDKVKFLQEAAIMGQFQHYNVVRMYGVILCGEQAGCPYFLKYTRQQQISYLHILIIFIEYDCTSSRAAS